MMRLTKKQLQYEIITLANNIQVHEALIGDSGEAKETLALLRAQLRGMNWAELDISFDVEQGNNIQPPKLIQHFYSAFRRKQ